MIEAFKCLKCGDIIYSRCLEDVRTCSCGNIEASHGQRSVMCIIKSTKDYVAISLQRFVTKKQLKQDFKNNTNKYGLIIGK